VLSRGGGTLDAASVLGDELGGLLGVLGQARAQGAVDEVRSCGARYLVLCAEGELVDASPEVLGETQVPLDSCHPDTCAVDPFVDDHGSRAVTGDGDAILQGRDSQGVSGDAGCSGQLVEL
jgi:hypothetical protein